MEKKVIQAFLQKNNYQILTIDEIKNKLPQLKITTIALEQEDIYHTQNGIISWLYNDQEHPITLDKEGQTNHPDILRINPEWYKEHLEEVDDLLAFICKNIHENNFSIQNQALISDKVIDGLSSNPNLTSVSLAVYEKNGYNLTEEAYSKFKNSTIKKVRTKGIVPALKENFDPLIVCNYNRPLISYYNYQDLCQGDELYITTEIPTEELPNLKYLHPNATIKLKNDSYQCLDEIIKHLNQYHKENKIKIDLENKEQFNQYLFHHPINFNNLWINVDNTELPLKEYLKFEKKLYELIEPAKNLSPFERYIYAYNVTKNFKEYSENVEDKKSSRNLYQILESKFMVCVGYSNMFGDLLSKSSIKNKSISVLIDDSYDKALSGRESVEGILKPTTSNGHARRYVYIKDEKYDIDGFYIADPTWDNDLAHDFYNYLAMTPSELTGTDRYNWLSPSLKEELFNVNSIGEFYQKFNFIFERNKMVFPNLKSLITDFITSELSPLAPDYVLKLKQKYPFFDKPTWPEDISDLIS